MKGYMVLLLVCLASLQLIDAGRGGGSRSDSGGSRSSSRGRVSTTQRGRVSTTQNTDTIPPKPPKPSKPGKPESPKPKPPKPSKPGKPEQPKPGKPEPSKPGKPKPSKKPGKPKPSDYTTRELKQIIDEKEAIINHKEATITNLEATIQRNEAEIRRNEAEIQRKEAIIQNQLNCPIDGVWSNFSEFGQCSATCGEGIKERTRTCTNPPPQHGGQQCQGVSKDTDNCILVDNCPVQGDWSLFSDWSVCSQTCGTGTKVRSRTCLGEDCDGPQVETESCFLIENCQTFARLAALEDCLPDHGIDFVGHDISGMPIQNIDAWEPCARLCHAQVGCFFWSYRNGYKECYLKTSNVGKSADGNYISGDKDCTRSKYC